MESAPNFKTKSITPIMSVATPIQSYILFLGSLNPLVLSGTDLLLQLLQQSLAGELCFALYQKTGEIRPRDIIIAGTFQFISVHEHGIDTLRFEPPCNIYHIFKGYFEKINAHQTVT